MKFKVGDKFRAYDREFIVIDVSNPAGVGTRRIPDPLLTYGEPKDGEIGFWEYRALRSLGVIK